MKLSINKVVAIASFSLIAVFLSSATYAEIVNMEKRNTNFSIDGNNGAIEGQQIYLWNTNNNNVNQQWEEISRGGDHYSYQKRNTNLCLDGGNGGSRRQPVLLIQCQANNQNQHWRKVPTSGGSFRLEKRNASGFSIDGDRGASRRQSIYLWNSNSNNVNQQWNFTGGSDSGSNDDDLEGLHPDITRVANIPASAIVRNPGGNSWKDSYSVGDRCYCDTTFDHDIGPIRVDTPIGNITVFEACERLGEGPGSQGRPIYNDVQCGNGPANDAGDEDYCPGRVDIGKEGCPQIGPTWNFD